MHTLTATLIAVVLATGPVFAQSGFRFTRDITADEASVLDNLAVTWNENHPDDPPITGQDYWEARLDDLISGYVDDVVKAEAKTLEEAYRNPANSARRQAMRDAAEGR